MGGSCVFAGLAAGAGDCFRDPGGFRFGSGIPGFSGWCATRRGFMSENKQLHPKGNAPGGKGSGPEKRPGRFGFLFFLLILLFLLSLCWDIYNQAASAKKGNTIIERSSDMNRVGNYYYNLLVDYKLGKDLKLYQMRDSILGEFGTLTRALNQIMSKWQRVAAWYQSLSTINTTVMSGLIYLYIALKALFGAFGVGSIVTYVGSLTQFKNGFTGLVDVLSDIFITAEALQEVFDFIDMPDKKYHGTLPVEKRAFCDGGDNDYEIEVRDVSFRYPGSDAYALRHVSCLPGFQAVFLQPGAECRCKCEL